MCLEENSSCTFFRLVDYISLGEEIGEWKHLIPSFYILS